MLKSKIYDDYANWWRFWLSKLPQRDTSSVSKAKAAVLLKSQSLAIAEDRLRFLRNSVSTANPLRCATGTRDTYIDEES